LRLPGFASDSVKVGPIKSKMVGTTLMPIFVVVYRACDVEPYAYLHHVLTELPHRASDADISDLLPFNFAKCQMTQSRPPQKTSL
jgi:IS66 C-terminal element